MTYIAKISTKGQVVIPHQIRQELKLDIDDRVTFELKNSTLTLKKVPTVDEMAGFLYKKGQKPLSNEEMDKLIGEAVVEDFLQKEMV